MRLNKKEKAGLPPNNYAEAARWNLERNSPGYANKTTERENRNPAVSHCTRKEKSKVASPIFLSSRSPLRSLERVRFDRPTQEQITIAKNKAKNVEQRYEFKRSYKKLQSALSDLKDKYIPSGEDYFEKIPIGAAIKEVFLIRLPSKKNIFTLAQE